MNIWEYFDVMRDTILECHNVISELVRMDVNQLHVGILFNLIECRCSWRFGWNHGFIVANIWECFYSTGHSVLVLESVVAKLVQMCVSEDVVLVALYFFD